MVVVVFNVSIKKYAMNDIMFWVTHKRIISIVTLSILINT